MAFGGGRVHNLNPRQHPALGVVVEGFFIHLEMCLFFRQGGSFIEKSGWFFPTISLRSTRSFAI
jgi:hypothetical protein